MAKEQIYINMGNGGGFWTDKEEYENNYRDSKGVKTGQEDYDKERQIRENEMQRDLQTVQQKLQDNKARKQRHIDNTEITKTIDKNIKYIDDELKEIANRRTVLKVANYGEEREQELRARRTVWTGLRREANNKDDR